jgi:hypothetical protein
MVAGGPPMTSPSLERLTLNVSLGNISVVLTHDNDVGQTIQVAPSAMA